jgi:hypothetical protein
MEALEEYELFVSIRKEAPNAFIWGIGQELELETGEIEFEFLAGGEEETLGEASLRVSEEIKNLF